MATLKLKQPLAQLTRWRVTQSLRRGEVSGVALTATLHNMNRKWRAYRVRTFMVEQGIATPAYLVGP